MNIFIVLFLSGLFSCVVAETKLMTECEMLQLDLCTQKPASFSVPVDLVVYKNDNGVIGISVQSEIRTDHVSSACSSSRYEKLIINDKGIRTKFQCRLKRKDQSSHLCETNQYANITVSGLTDSVEAKIIIAQVTSQKGIYSKITTLKELKLHCEKSG